MVSEIDETDRRIIRELQKNGRMSNQELSERINLSPSPCLRRTKALEESGVIKGYTALIDQQAYGLPVTALIRIRLERHAEDSVRIFEARVRATPEILDCYLVTGDADYLLRVLVESLDAYEDFIRRKIHVIPGITSIDTSLAYGIIKQSHIYP